MYRVRTVALGLILVTCPAAALLLAQQSPAPSFIPHYTFAGSALADWKAVGGAAWKAEDGVITGTAGSRGGLLILDRVYEDAAVFSRFRCDESCRAGILVRLEDTPAGMVGAMVSVDGSALSLSRVTLDASGQIVNEEPLDDPENAYQYPSGASSWNLLEVFVQEHEVSTFPDGKRSEGPGGALQEAPDLSGTEALGDFPFGPVALLVREGTVEFADVSTRNLLRVDVDPEHVADGFRVQRLNEFAYAWGADIADINGDGMLDVVSGPFYYLGPDFTERYEYYHAFTRSPGEDYVEDMISVTGDFTGDGLVDILATERRPMVLYVNPGKEARRWDRFEALPEVRSEVAIAADVDSDGQPEVVYVGEDGRVAYGEPNPANPTGLWNVHKVSESFGEGGSIHGIGVGDVNGDGRADILQSHGWWEQPASNPTASIWPHHDILFGFSDDPYGGGGEISVYDFNGDGLNDIVATLEAHGWGLAWFEQQRDDTGAMTFRQHVLMHHFATRNAGGVTFSQPHSGATLADIDGDGVMDFITGKRHWSHLDSFSDPDPDGPAVVYWYRTVRDPEAPGGVRFEPELIHNRSGVGAELAVADIDGNGAPDVVTSGTHGTFILWNEGQ